MPGTLLLLLTTGMIAMLLLAARDVIRVEATSLLGGFVLLLALAGFACHCARVNTLKAQLNEALYHDRLTGLVNRELFKDLLGSAIDRVNLGRQKMYAVLLLDFDRFKVINDALGHEMGDDLLRQVSIRIADAVRAAGAGNQIGRFGGDEFHVLLNDCAHVDDVVQVANLLLAQFLQPFRIQGRDVSLQASIGMVVSGQDQRDISTVLRNADLAMYEAKRAGRGCALLFNEGMHTRQQRRMAIESGLRHALGSNQLSLAFQPIVDLDTGRRSSIEALVRWTHPELGPVPPSEFVPIAEESGLIIQLGEWVMRESCAALARMRRLDPEQAPSVVSVNVSRVEMAHGAHLLRVVRDALAAAQLSPASLQLEVTEREVMRDPAASLALMQELQEIGVRLAMDDFGTGTSSLGCLSEYPFDVIKIDRSFIDGLSAGPDRLAVLHATITLVENLGKSSVGEGVETAEQLTTLQAMGCHYAQGYYLGKPMAEADVVESERTLTVPRLQLLG